MRKIKEVLRLRFEVGLGQRETKAFERMTHEEPAFRCIVWQGGASQIVHVAGVKL
jgi:hypothetical protein